MGKRLDSYYISSLLLESNYIKCYLSRYSYNIILITSLYRNGLINRCKYISMLRSFLAYDGFKISENVLWYKNVYHCTITGEWYNCIYPTDYLDSVYDYCKDSLSSGITLSHLYESISIITDCKKSIIYDEVDKIMSELVNILGRVSLGYCEKYYKTILVSLLNLGNATDIIFFSYNSDLSIKSLISKLLRQVSELTYINKK